MRVSLTVLAVALFLPLAASAQLAGGLGDTAPFSLTLSPQYPQPYSRASIAVQSDSLELANATMVVSVAGKEIYRGSVQPVSLMLGRAGSTTKADVTITSNGTSNSQSISIQPEEAALVAEPVSSVPPLYLGKSLVPLSGNTRVVAVANFRTASGGAIDPAALSYSWTVDDTKIANSSGIGKSTILVASPLQYRARTVSVAITSQDSNYVGGDSLTLSPQDPSVRIYESDPLLGIRFDRALSNTFAITGVESTLYAAPFSLPTSRGLPVFQWFVNGAAAQVGNSITLRPTGGGEGSSSLSLVASGDNNTTTNTSLSLTFGSAPSSNFFGL